MLNKVQLLGNLGSDPEVRFTANGTPVANLQIATNERWTDQQGQKQESVEWHHVVVWGKMAEACGKYLSKGRQVFLEGKIKTRKWQDREGADRFTTEIHTRNIVFLGGPRKAQTETAIDESVVPEATEPSVSQDARLLLNSDNLPF